MNLTLEYCVWWRDSPEGTVQGFSPPQPSPEDAIKNFSVKFMPKLDKVVYREVGSEEWKIYEGEIK